MYFEYENKEAILSSFKTQTKSIKTQLCPNRHIITPAELKTRLKCFRVRAYEVPTTLPILVSCFI
jgi:hypothetical protein